MKVHLTDLFFLFNRKDEIFNLLKMRQLQLNIQKEIDQQLAVLPCAKTINNLLLYERELNRELVQKMNRTETVKDYVTTLEESYNIIEKHQQYLLTNCNCYNIEQYIKNIYSNKYDKA